MATALPYLSSPGTVDTVFDRIKHAATPSRVTNDFVTTVLQIKGGTGATIPPFLKKIGFLNSAGAPTAIYDHFRNDSTSASAVAEAIKTGYKSLYQVNEYAHRLGDAELKGLIVQVTGLEKDNRVLQLIHQTLKKLIKHADFDASSNIAATVAPPQPATVGPLTVESHQDRRGINLSYTINLNLPSTTNIEVFNAIFKSLREHLLNE